jgi:hypothetical protein
MRTQAIRLADRLLAGVSRMGWVLRLVETGIDGPARVIDVLDIIPLGGLGEIAKLGLTLAEAKQILARLQQAVVAVQADDHAVLRPDCSSCGQACHVKDWRLHRVAPLFGTVAVRLPRFRCAGCAGDSRRTEDRQRRMGGVPPHRANSVARSRRPGER